MRNYFFLIIILFMMMILSCSKTLTVQGRVFAVNDQYKSTSLEFINDTVCIYIQELHCEVSEQYRKRIITCLYEVLNSNIILKNINYHPDSSYTYFELPEEEKNKCEFIKKDIDSTLIKKEGYKWSNIKYHYGHFNNVGIDTFTYSSNNYYINYYKYSHSENEHLSFQCFKDIYYIPYIKIFDFARFIY